jgi:alginate O-acetyltransferase complex protein AlgI
VYIPLGGNKKGKSRQMFNMFVVWAFTGFWHGASWNYLLWGIYCFVLLILEKHVFKNVIEKMPKVIKWLVTSGFVIIGWMIFRSENLSDFGTIVGSMFSFNVTSEDFNLLSLYTQSYAMYFIPAAILAFPIFPAVHKKLCSQTGKAVIIRHTIFYIGLLFVFFIAVCFLVQSTYNPFIYFRF